MNNKQLVIDVDLIRRLVTSQFPKWENLSIQPVVNSGWDNKTFHLGEDMLVRMPSSSRYAITVEKEHHWLPKLAPLLPLLIPKPLGLGKPEEEYPWKWSIYRWIKGDTAASNPIEDLSSFAACLAKFLIALQRIESSKGPLPGLHSFYRGAPLATYDKKTRKALALLKDKIDTNTATEVWEKALSTSWSKPPVWVHGDISAGNLLIQKGKLRAVIDFGQLTVGDPACDLAIAWTLFKDESRKVFRKMLPLDPGTWIRGRAWALWKALIVAAGFTNPNNTESIQCWRIINDIIEEHESMT